MNRDVSLLNSYNYGDAVYWDSRYQQEGAASAFDWYQRYSALRPFVLSLLPTESRILMLGCGNALISQDMLHDGYRDIINIDISSIVIQMMQKKYADIPHLKYMQMDARDMSFFGDESFDCVIDKGTLDSLMCGTDAPLGGSKMLAEVNRVMKPGGIYMLITYGNPSVRVPHLRQAGSSWKITLYIIPRPGYQSRAGNISKSVMEPIPLTEKGLLPASFVLEDPDSHYMYVCVKMRGLSGNDPRNVDGSLIDGIQKNSTNGTRKPEDELQ